MNISVQCTVSKITKRNYITINYTSESIKYFSLLKLDLLAVFGISKANANKNIKAGKWSNDKFDYSVMFSQNNITFRQYNKKKQVVCAEEFYAKVSEEFNTRPKRLETIPETEVLDFHTNPTNAVPTNAVSSHAPSVSSHDPSVSSHDPSVSSHDPSVNSYDPFVSSYTRTNILPTETQMNDIQTVKTVFDEVYTQLDPYNIRYWTLVICFAEFGKIDQIRQIRSMLSNIDVCFDNERDGIIHYLNGGDVSTILLN